MPPFTPNCMTTDPTINTQQSNRPKNLSVNKKSNTSNNSILINNNFNMIKFRSISECSDCDCSFQIIIDLIDKQSKYICTCPHFATLRREIVRPLVRSMFKHKYYITKNKKFLNHSCPVMKFLAQAVSNILSGNPCSKASLFEEWIVVTHVLSHKKAQGLLDPLNGFYQRVAPVSTTFGIIRVPFMADYTVSKWKVQEGSLYRTIKHTFAVDIQTKIIGEVKKKSADALRKNSSHSEIKLPILPILPWLDTKLLNPQILLEWGF